MREKQVLCPDSCQHLGAGLCPSQPGRDLVSWPVCFLTIQKPSLSASVWLSHKPTLHPAS